jgi:hypothetical protein
MKFKARNFSDAKFQTVMGHEGPFIEYTLKDDVITLENGVAIKFSITPKDIEGYEVLKEYVHDYSFDGVPQQTFTTMDNFGHKYLIYKWVSRNLTERTVRTSTGLNADQKALLKAERQRYLASKGRLPKKQTDEMGSEVVIVKPKSKK